MRATFRLLGGVGALVAACVLVGVRPVHAQELACRVQLDDSQLSGSEYSFLDELDRRIEEYLNTRNWTDDQYLRHERIACTMQIVIQEAVSLSEFRTRLVLTSRRPIHGTSQSTAVLRVSDSNWRFEYSRGTSLNFDLDQYNALTSVLDFYAYVILGYDYDTFSPLGGTEHFEVARRVADRADATGDPGWSSVGSQNNRLTLISALLDQRHEPLRRAYYRYHLEGLDRFVEETETARKEVLGALKTLQQVNQEVSNSYPMSLFFSTKYQELSAIFVDSELSTQAYGLLTRLDPSHSSEYNKLVQ